MSARPILFLLAVALLSSCQSAPSDVERLAPGIDALIGDTAALEQLADGYKWTEGPLWIKDGDFLIFSDTETNTIHRWEEGRGALAWLNPSGYTSDAPRGGGMGSNGLTLDSQGRLVLAQHGDRRIAVMDAPLSAPEPQFLTLVDRIDDLRFNSPNDLVFDSTGTLYFTDPPYGLASPDSADLSITGVYTWREGEGALLVDASLRRPNGIAISPDGTTLYVANSDPERPFIKAYDRSEDGLISGGRVFFDASALLGPENPGLPDGLRLDVDGNLFATGPGGVLVIGSDGTHLGTIRTGKAAANVAFGDDGRMLYITASDALLRIPVTTTGYGFGE